MHERLEQVFQLQKLCINELEQSQKNSQQYSSNLMNLAKKVNANWQESNRFLAEYDSFITAITDVMEMARKFNLQMHLHNMRISEMYTAFSSLNKKGYKKNKSKSDSSSSSSLLTNLSTDLFPAEEYNLNSETDKEFIYPRLNLNKIYKENVKISGRVTYIKSLKDLSFYIFDKSSKYLDTVLEIAKSLELRQYTCMPAANEVFGCVLEKHIFRAVLSSKTFYDEDMNEQIYPCYLLDTGEILPLKADHIMYRLTNDVKSIPAQAVPCQLKTLSNNPFVQQQEMEDKLKALQCENCWQLKVVSIENNTLLVEIDYDDCVESIKENGLEDVNLQNGSSTTDALEADRQQLTADELEMLYEEPLCTSNAMKAVMGYDPQDDKRICRFYDPNIGGCFKGANCKLEHTLRQPDGWTKDLLPSSSTIIDPHPITIFPAGSVINITPTYIGQLDTFYAQINDPHQTDTVLVWNDEDIPSWKHLKKPPYIFELVLSRYTDGLWYRAKIMSHDDDYKMFQVFYVDYGNYQIVHFRNLASIDMSVAKMPLQAVLCKLDGVRERQSLSADDRKSGIETLCEIILNKSMDVKVISHHEDLVISFVEIEEYPIPNILLKKGLLELN